MLDWLRRQSGGANVLARIAPIGQETIAIAGPSHGIPTVEFDSRQVTEAVKAGLKRDITEKPEIDAAHFVQLYNAALRSIAKGGDLGTLASAIVDLNLPGMTTGRAGQISRSLNNKATVRIGRDRLTSLGIKYATWIYSDAPCQMNPRNPSAKDTFQDAAHKAASGKRYEIGKGLRLNGRWTLPGVEKGCKCVSISIVPGLD